MIKVVYSTQTRNTVRTEQKAEELNGRKGVDFYS